MKKTIFVCAILVVLLTGLTPQVWGLQSPDQAVKSKKPPTKQAVPPPAVPQAHPKSAPEAVPQPASPMVSPVAAVAPQPVPTRAVPCAQAVPKVSPASPPAPASAKALPRLTPLATAPEGSPAPSPVPAPAQQAAPQPVQMRKEVVKVNYIDAIEAHSILTSYKSPRGRIQVQRNRNTLIIEDTPDFVDKLLSILRELDVMPLDLMFTVDVILGGMEEEPGDPVPGSDRLLKELRGLLKYKHFSRLDTTLIKIQDNGRSAQRMGGQGIGLLLELYPRHIKDGNKDGFQVELSLRQTTRRHGRRDEQGNIIEYIGSPLEKSLSLLHTTLSLKDGERSVVGVSKLNGGDTALILVIEGNVIK